MKLLPLSAIMLLAGIHAGSSQVLFSENFDTDPTSNWTVFQGGGIDSSADFYFDYSTLGIPPAPNTTTTRGVRFLVNQTDGVFQGISASPVGQGFNGNYRLRADMWMNYNGPLGVGGSGSTQCGTIGVGGTGSQVHWAGANSGAVLFAVTGEGGSTQDYRCYSNNTHVAVASGAYAAGTTGETRDAGNAYYSGFGGKTAPAKQLELYPGQTGTTPAGAVGFAWRDVIIEKVGNIVTWTIDGKLIATSQTPANFSTNIFLGAFDINAGSSADPNDHLIATIFDNVRVESLGTSVGVTASVANAKEGGANGEFTITRSGSTSGALTVNFTLTGTATNGVDYTSAPSSVSFADGQSTATVAIQPIDDSVAESTETAILTIETSPNYALAGASATVSILDNETPELSIAPVASTMYERVSGDYVTYRITRRGDLDTYLAANIGYSGTANSTRFVPISSVEISAGVAATNFNVSPIDDSTLNGNQTIIATVQSGSGYTIGSPASATATIIDDENEPETVLFSDSLADDSSANWTVRFGANNLVDDYSVEYSYDFGWDGIPAAPSGASRGLKLSVNKNDPTANGTAGLNLYPKDRTFSGNYALRFNMYMQQNAGAGTTEFALFGINHSGEKTNWFRQNGTSEYNNPPLDVDGLWFSVISDASASAPGDYVLFTRTNAASPAGVLASAAATSFTQVYKKPPYSAGSGAGVPGNLPFSPNGVWADVEVSKVGNVVTMSINKTPVLQYTNTTEFTSGNIMIGYTDAYESIGGGGGAAFFSNLRVISLPASIVPASVSGIAVVNGGTQVQIDFTGSSDDAASAFTLQSAATVNGSFSDIAATVISTGSGKFRATAPINGTTRFYRIRR